MNKNFCEYTAEEFTAALASSDPVPGGGGAAALCGALAASLCSMATSLTCGNPKYAAVKTDMRSIADKAENLRERLMADIDRDAAAFRPLSEVYSMPKDAPCRAALLRERTLEACAAPMEMLRAAAAVVGLLEEAREKCSKLLLSDVGCAAALAAAALETAAMNVFVNTRMLKDDRKAEEISCEARAILNEYVPRARAEADAVMKYLTEGK